MKAGGHCDLLDRIVTEIECYYCTHHNIRMSDCEKLVPVIRRKTGILDNNSPFLDKYCLS